MRGARADRPGGLSAPTRALLLSVVLALPATARAEAGRLVGTDKLLHLGATFALGAAGYGVGAVLSEGLGLRLGLGLGLPLVASLGKELADLAGLGEPDWRDLVADLVGAALGVLVAWAIEAAFEPRAGPRRRQRAALAAALGRAATGSATYQETLAPLGPTTRCEP